MNIKRIREIQEFADEFNNKLKSANEEYETKRVKIHRPNIQTQIQPYIKSRKRRKVFSQTVLMEQEAWKPTRAVGNYFGEFKKLTNRYELNAWEMSRIPHLSQRSYVKSKDLANGKDIHPTKGVGQEFTEHMKKNASMIQLSPLGQSILDKFVIDNLNKEKRMRQIEQRIWEYRHLKPPIELNPWKNSFHIIKEFSVPHFDKIHSFKIVNRRKKS